MLVGTATRWTVIISSSVYFWKKEIENHRLICRLTTFDARQLNMLSCILHLQIVKTSSFCFLNLLGLVISFKVIGKRLVKLWPKRMTLKPSAKLMFNALAPIIIKTETPQVFEILNVSRLLNAFLCFIWNNSQSLPNFQQHFCNPLFDSGIVICIFRFVGVKMSSG